MSTLAHTTPILYINMGGEMLYVLQQRLQTQKISPDKTIQVINDVIYAMLNPKMLAMIFGIGGSGLAGQIGQLRPILERVVLSSIMKLDANSMDKLFDLMIMMVKYQLTTASGPREVILATLNHIDAIRDMAVLDRSLGEHIDATHRLVIDTYGQMTHKQIWLIRSECLRELEDHNVRVSILLRLGMQNQDATFNRMQQKYDERYQEREELLDSVKLVDYVDEDGTMGVLTLFGDRATLLGKNAYCYSSGSFGQLQQQQTNSASNSWQNLNQQALASRSNKAMRQELQTLATQLGKEETAPARPFSLHLFQQHNDNDNHNDKRQSPHEQDQLMSAVDDSNTLDDNNPSLDQYKSNLIENVNSQFADNDNARTETMDLMNLLDIM